MRARSAVTDVKYSALARFLLWSILSSALHQSASAECGQNDLRPSVQYNILAEGLIFPWSIAFLPNGDMLVTERPGRIRVVRDGALLDHSIEGMPQLVNLFDIIAHPEFSSNSFVYVAYSARADRADGLEVLRAKLVNDRLVDGEVIFQATPKASPGPLSGGRLLFMSDGSLLITVGDQRDGLSNGHDPLNHFGTVLRITDSGLPVPESETNTDERLPEVYSFGLRNIQGIEQDPVTNTVWITDHGPTGGDELNILRPASNYGWPIEHFGEDTFAEGLTIVGLPASSKYEQPVLTWTPAIAPSGLAVYRGTAITEWSDSMFIGSLVGCHIERFALGERDQLQSKEKLLGELGERIRDVQVSPDGDVYILTDELNGKLIRIMPLPHESET